MELNWQIILSHPLNTTFQILLLTTPYQNNIREPAGKQYQYLNQRKG
jgi:hypothetical protein